MGVVDVVEARSVQDKEEDLDELDDVGIEKIIAPKQNT
jgi:hypothetical protein